MDDETAQSTWDGFNGEENHTMFWAGTWAAAIASGLHYDDLADTDLISPEIDLTTASSASLAYWRSGQSEFDFDFLRVYARTVGSTTWTEIDEMSGDIFNNGYAGFWEESVRSLNAFVGSKVQLRFGFTSDEATVGANLGGWFVDDISVTGESGTPTTTIISDLSASQTFGVGSLETVFAFGGESNGTITGYSLDFGDGSDVLSETEPGLVGHTYETGGQYVATLTVAVGAETESTSVAIDVAKPGNIEVRIAARPWVDAGAASSDWTADLDISGLSGSQLIEVRYYDTAGNLVVDSRAVNVV